MSRAWSSFCDCHHSRRSGLACHGVHLSPGCDPCSSSGRVSLALGGHRSGRRSDHVVCSCDRDRRSGAAFWLGPCRLDCVYVSVLLCPCCVSAGHESRGGRGGHGRAAHSDRLCALVSGPYLPMAVMSSEPYSRATGLLLVAQSRAPNSCLNLPPDHKRNLNLVPLALPPAVLPLSLSPPALMCRVSLGPYCGLFRTM